MKSATTTTKTNGARLWQESVRKPFQHIGLCACLI